MRRKCAGEKISACIARILCAKITRMRRTRPLNLSFKQELVERVEKRAEELGFASVSAYTAALYVADQQRVVRASRRRTKR